jgi:transketolase
LTLNPPLKEQTLDQLSINTIRFLAVDAVQKANSGHPGLPMGAAPMAYTLWTRFLKHNPTNPHWADRDRFVLSAGHGSMLLYALLHLTGYDLSLDDLKSFRQFGSKTPGHPEYHHTAGVETTTGPLGQGISTAVGMAFAERFLAATFNRPGHEIVNHYTYVLASDGDLMEGVSNEASSLAGHYKLNKLIVLWDDNEIALSTATSAVFTEDTVLRYQAYGWHTIRVKDGNNVEEIAAALEEARAQTDKPTFIAVRTIIGYGSPKKQGTSGAHGEPLGKDEVAAAKANLGWPTDTDFLIPGEALEHFRAAVEDGQMAEAEWNARFDAYAQAFPDLAKLWDQAQTGTLPAGWDADLTPYPAGSAALATRDAGGVALNAIAKHFPTLIGGDADLATSTKTVIKDGGNFAPDNYAGRNLRFGVREHAMGTIINGLAVHGGIIKPYTATFFTFSDYMKPAIRLAALMGLKNVFVFTHDSIGVGEDGPTHEPIEHLAALRAIPHFVTLRPADGNETLAAWKTAMELNKPAAIILTRQKLPILPPEGVFEGVARGGYVVAGGSEKPSVILIGTGSEVSICMAAYEQLTQAGITARVVSLPSFELFRAQDQAYKDSVLPPDVTARVAIEAASPLGWHEWVGLQGKIIALDHFGTSAPYETIYKEFGLTPEAVVNAAKSLLQK